MFRTQLVLIPVLIALSACSESKKAYVEVAPVTESVSEKDLGELVSADGSTPSAPAGPTTPRSTAAPKAAKTRSEQTAPHSQAPSTSEAPQAPENPSTTEAPRAPLTSAPDETAAVDTGKSLKRVQLIRSSTKSEECTIRVPRFTNERQDLGVKAESLLGLFRDKTTTDAQKKSIAWYLKLDSVDKVEAKLTGLVSGPEAAQDPEPWIAHYDKCEPMAKFAMVLEERHFHRGPVMSCTAVAPSGGSPIFMEHVIRVERDGRLTAEVSEVLSDSKEGERSKPVGALQLVLRESSNTKCPIAFANVAKNAKGDGISQYKICLKDWTSAKPGEIRTAAGSVSFETTNQRVFRGWKHDCRQEDDFKAWIDGLK